MDIILARHGETEWNVGEVFRGRADIDLNEMGRKQAALLAAYLSQDKIETVYSGPLKRALNTARTIASDHGIHVQIAPGLDDLNFGEWEGLQVEVVRQRYSEPFALWVGHPELVTLPGGETLGQVRERAMKVVEEAVKVYSGTVVIVTHRVVIKILTLALLGLDNSHFWNVVVDTCSLTLFRHDRGRFILIKHNDNSFLRPLKTAPLKDF